MIAFPHQGLCTRVAHLISIGSMQILYCEQFNCV
ncbi:hypothetical protein Rmet_6616 (plasmid) [Cupriavidus metallidurans CH34]|uniref:Uncharacterized protein n=1 Tax=Cupriavidus metallidurans (strain ATCC 43123 / DSM 2839 / NBRC 102507 / CH34) TaxID=266264 RepID=D3DY45_CUPMC|nr:hypothetical protein Rmet_6616 [Cupriavidus metallidurans CH34]